MYFRANISIVWTQIFEFKIEFNLIEYFQLVSIQIDKSFEFEQLV